jgi:hypothetical protein
MRGRTVHRETGRKETRGGRKEKRGRKKREGRKVKRGGRNTVRPLITDAQTGQKKTIYKYLPQLRT